MGSEGGGIESCHHRCRGRRPGLIVAVVVRPTAAVISRIFFVISYPAPPSWSDWYSSIYLTLEKRRLRRQEPCLRVYIQINYLTRNLLCATRASSCCPDYPTPHHGCRIVAIHQERQANEQALRASRSPARWVTIISTISCGRRMVGSLHFSGGASRSGPTDVGRTSTPSDNHAILEIYPCSAKVRAIHAR